MLSSSGIGRKAEILADLSSRLEGEKESHHWDKS